MEFGLNHSAATDVTCLVADYWSWTAVLALSAVRCDGCWPTASVATATVGAEDSDWSVIHSVAVEVVRWDLDDRTRTAVSAQGAECCDGCWPNQIGRAHV